NYRGGQLAAEHLLKQGFTRIGMVQALDRSEKYQKREQGFEETLEKLNHPLKEEYVTAGITRKHGGFSEEAGYEAIHILHNRGSMPEAIFCSNDSQALGAMHALEELNLSVPNDVALIGYDNIKSARYLNLTTIDQKMLDMGGKAIQRLEARLFEKPEDLWQVTVEPELVIRKSTQKNK
ncbi:MAG TPA: substrate-binding domain-containing protein, partial [Balneolales bacterium]|nr:substrate-binding domain-containing protein [Balneolales bacterium]